MKKEHNASGSAKEMSKHDKGKKEPYNEHKHETMHRVHTKGQGHSSHKEK